MARRRSLMGPKAKAPAPVSPATASPVAIQRVKRTLVSPPSQASERDWPEAFAGWKQEPAEQT